MFAAGTATKNISAFDPRALGSCALWLDAADANTITFSSGSNIATWKDKGPSGITFAPGQSGAIAAAAPTYNATNQFVYFNNGNSGNISAASQGLQATTTWEIPAVSEAKTMYCVVNILNGTNSGFNGVFRAFRGSTCNAPNSFFGVQISANNSLLNAVVQEQYNFVSGAWQRSIDTNYGTPSTNSTILTSYVSTRASTFIFFSGIRVGSNTTSFTPTVNGSQVVPEVSFGAGYDNRCFTGYVYEFLYFNAEHNNTQRQAVEGYLAWKWGQTGALPAGHPYKTSFPTLRALSPLDMSTMPTLWFDAANAGTITSNTSNITTWSNSGTNGCNATSNTSTALTGIATQNNLNVAQFSNTFMGIAPTIFTANERSCFFAFKVQTNISGTYLALFTTSNTIGGGQELIIDFTGTNPFFFTQRNGTGQLVSFSTINSPVNNFWQLALVNSGTTTASNAGSMNGSNLPLTASSLATYTLNEGYMIGASYALRNFQLGDMIIYNNALPQNERQQIEGYLGWKWGITSLMPTTHPYRYTMPMSVAFNPRSLSNCQFWFDAADATTITSNTSNVTTWTNKGVIDVNAASNASFTTGRTGINTINGLNVINFIAGASMQLTSVSTLNQTRTVFVVTKNLTQLNGTTNQFQGYLNAGAGFPGWQDFYLAFDSGNYTIVCGRNGGDANAGAVFFKMPTNPLNIVNVISGTISGSTATNFGTVNGSTMTLTVNQAAGTTLFVSTLGNAVLATSAYNTAQDMGEYIQYDYALTPSDRYRVEGYLAWKWGVASSLPENHPFKKAAP